MNIRRMALLMILLLTMPILAACGGDDDGGGSSLGQSYDAGGLSFSYPDGWVARAEDDGSVIMANSQEILDMAAESSEEEIPGDAQVFFVIASSVEDAGGIGPAEMVGAFVAQAATDENVTLGTAEAVTLGGLVGSKISSSDSSIKSEGAMYVVGDESVMVIFVGMAGEGSYDGDLAQSILETVSYTAPE